jgi:hypothetical protein
LGVSLSKSDFGVEAKVIREFFVSGRISLFDLVYSEAVFFIKYVYSIYAVLFQAVVDSVTVFVLNLVLSTGSSIISCSLNVSCRIHQIFIDFVPPFDILRFL